MSPDRRTLTPPVRHTVEAKLLLKTGEEASLGTTLSNAEGPICIHGQTAGANAIAQNHSFERTSRPAYSSMPKDKALLKTEISAVLDGEAVLSMYPLRRIGRFLFPEAMRLRSRRTATAARCCSRSCKRAGHRVVGGWETGQSTTLNDIISSIVQPHRRLMPMPILFASHQT